MSTRAGGSSLFQRGDERTSERAGFSSIPPLYMHTNIHLQFAWEKWPHKLQSGYKLEESIVAASERKAGERHTMLRPAFE